MSPPQSKSVPILAAFFSCCLMVVACSCVFTVLTICLFSRKAETHEMSPLIISEWRFAAMAVDRLCLYLFSVFIAVSTCGIIMPHILTFVLFCKINRIFAFHNHLSSPFYAYVCVN
ncbi:hypothetical protein Aduo_005582 [Ancylostoma duodenale]